MRRKLTIALLLILAGCRHLSPKGGTLLDPAMPELAEAWAAAQCNLATPANPQGVPMNPVTPWMPQWYASAQPGALQVPMTAVEWYRMPTASFQCPVVNMTVVSCVVYDCRAGTDCVYLNSELQDREWEAENVILHRLAKTNPQLEPSAR